MSKKKYPDDIAPPKGVYVKSLHIKNSVQEHYIKMMRESTVTFCTGPAGTGKTFLATHTALTALLAGEVDKIILTRPIIATEDIGYLPGTMDEKIHPYVLPLFDAIESHLGPVKAKDMLTNGSIEVIPLAYMRGRSLNRAFLILDEAQNTTQDQMKMFLTRLGAHSKMVVTGDCKQSDLKVPKNGLEWAVEKLQGANKDISVVAFRSENIVRHPLIESILLALEGKVAPLAELDEIIRPRRSTTSAGALLRPIAAAE